MYSAAADLYSPTTASSGIDELEREGGGGGEGDSNVAIRLQTCPPTCCNCETLESLRRFRGRADERVAELVRVPSAASGFLDAQTGKQVGSFMTYVICFGVPVRPTAGVTLQEHHTVRRRYSDFEHLHAHFERVYPFSIVPPIPQKQPLNSTRRRASCN